MKLARPDLLAIAYALVALLSVAIFGPSPASIGVPLVLFLVVLADGVFRPRSSVLVPTIAHGPREGREIALTFDDGPDPGSTPRILDALSEAGAEATFFVIGENLERHPELARRIVREGHELANHSYAHSRLLNFRGPRAMAEEIERGARAVRAVAEGGARPLYRPPIGLKNPALGRVARELGLVVVAWSLHGRDTRTDDAERIASRVLARVRPGDIVLLHDGSDAGRSRRATAEALPRILRGLEAKGLRSVTVSTLLGRSERRDPKGAAA